MKRLASAWNSLPEYVVNLTRITVYHQQIQKQIRLMEFWTAAALCFACQSSMPKE